MDHVFFIAASYVVSVLGLALLAGWILIDSAAQKRALAELEARGVKRRSKAAAAEPAAPVMTSGAGEKA